MPYQDFRQFLDVLKHEGELVEIDRMFDLSDVGKALKKSYERQGRALLFNRTGTMCPLVGGVYSTRSKALLAFESTEQELLGKISSGLAKPIPPEIVSKPALCQEHVLTGNDIDIRRFPIPT